jgi:thiol-disulfide isomerase/thioredoxin
MGIILIDLQARRPGLGPQLGQLPLNERQVVDEKLLFNFKSHGSYMIYAVLAGRLSQLAPFSPARPLTTKRQPMSNVDTNAGPAQEPSANSPQKSSRVANWLALAVIGGLALLYLTVVRPGNDSGIGARHPAIGRTLRTFELQPLTGQAAPLERAGLKGQVVLLNFWGTWCPPCRRELPHILNLAVKYANRKDFRLLAVSCGNGPDTDIESLRRETQAFLQRSQIDLDTYADQYGATRRAVSRVASLDDSDFSYPTTVLLDQQGVIRGYWEGYSLSGIDEMQGLIEKLLAGNMPVAQNSPR